jgi:hypothetical protein
MSNISFSQVSIKRGKLRYCFLTSTTQKNCFVFWKENYLVCWRRKITHNVQFCIYHEFMILSPTGLVTRHHTATLPVRKIIEQLHVNMNPTMQRRRSKSFPGTSKHKKQGRTTNFTLDMLVQTKLFTEHPSTSENMLQQTSTSHS